MKILKHLILNVFVTTTGIAAFFHSTWALGTFFAGNEPLQGTWDWVFWVIPGGLIAFALDIGQIATAGEIKRGQRSMAKYVTFGVLAAATYYLQFLYMAHHMPALPLAAGISAAAQPAATFLRDAAIWILPALLPISTLMYTFSSQHAEPDESPVLESLESEQQPDESEQPWDEPENFQQPSPVNGAHGGG